MIDRLLLAILLLLPGSLLGQSRFVKSYPTVLDMINAPNLNDVNTNIFCAGYRATNDGGGGLFVFVRNSTAVTNLGTIFSPTNAATPGRLLREFSGPVILEWFGAYGNGTTDDTMALTNALAFYSDVEATPLKRYRIGPVVLTKPCRINFRGSTLLPDTTTNAFELISFIENTNRFVLENITFEQYAAVVPQNIIKCTDIINVTIDHCRFWASAASNSVIWNKRGYGLVVTRCEWRNIVAPYVIYQTHTGQFDLNFSYATLITQSDLSGASGIGIGIEGGSCFMQGTIIEGCVGGGIKHLETFAIVGLIVDSCHFEENPPFDILLAWQTNTVSQGVFGARVSNCLFGNDQTNRIQIGGFAYVTVSDNFFYRGGITGNSNAPGSSRLVAINNVRSQDTAGFTNPHVIQDSLRTNMTAQIRLRSPDDYVGNPFDSSIPYERKSNDVLTANTTFTTGDGTKESAVASIAFKQFGGPYSGRIGSSFTNLDTTTRAVMDFWVNDNLDVFTNVMRLHGTGHLRVNGRYQYGGDLGPILVKGGGTPEGVITAPVGSIYSRTNGAAGTTLYVKESGDWTTTGWVAYGTGGGSGTVTHTAGALTLDLPVFGNGGDDIKVGTKSGTGTELPTTQSPTIVTPTILQISSSVRVTGAITNDALTASRLVATDANKALVSTISSANAASSATDETGTGNWVFSAGASMTDLIVGGSFQLPNGAAPTTDAFGEIAGDNNAWAAGRGTVQIFDGTANAYVVAALASDVPSNGQVPTWNTGGTITWETVSGGGNPPISSLVDALANNTLSLEGYFQRWNMGFGPSTPGGAGVGLELFEAPTPNDGIGTLLELEQQASGNADALWIRRDGTNVFNVGTNRITVGTTFGFSTSPAGVHGANTFAAFDANTNLVSGSTGAGLGLSAGALSWTPETRVNNVTIFDSANATRTLTFGLSGATDPVLTLGNDSADFTTGILKEGGNNVINAGDTLAGDVTGTLASGATAVIVDKGSEDFSLTGDISPAQITSDQNDYNPANLATASTLRLSTDASRNLTGLAGGADGRLLVIHNVGVQNLVLVDESASSSAANRFALNANVTIGADQGVILQYDSTSSRWRELSGPGGGGGSGITVREDDTSPSYSGVTTLSFTTNSFVVSQPAGAEALVKVAAGFFHAHAGTTDLEIWQAFGQNSWTSGGATVTPAVDTLYAVPFWSGSGGTLDRLALQVTTLAASGTARVGIYATKARSNIYPGALVAGSAQLDTSTTGVKADTGYTASLEPNRYYWAVVLTGTAAPVIRGIGVASTQTILGVTSTSFSADQTMLTVAQAYGALPATFPAGATATSAAVPKVVGRYSAIP